MSATDSALRASAVTTVRPVRDIAMRQVCSVRLAVNGTGSFYRTGAAERCNGGVLTLPPHCQTPVGRVVALLAGMAGWQGGPRGHRRASREWIALRCGAHTPPLPAWAPHRDVSLPG